MDGQTDSTCRLTAPFYSTSRFIKWDRQERVGTYEAFDNDVELNNGELYDDEPLGEFCFSGRPGMPCGSKPFSHPT